MRFKTPLETMRGTVAVIGRAILDGSEYLPTRNYAASLATTAAPKDYLGQLNAVYDNFVRKWRYVKDPAHKELVTASPEASYRLVMAGDGVGVGLGRGAGDCDCATIAIGSQLQSIGFPVRIATTAAPGAMAGPMFGHVFAQAFVPKIGWVTVDPVLHPFRPFGATAPHSRVAFWDLNGKLLGYNGNVSGLSGSDKLEGSDKMRTFGPWTDYSGLYGIGDDSGSDPLDWEAVGLSNWGYLSPEMGMIDGDEVPHLMAEVTPDEFGLARTPMIELSPDDYRYMKVMRTPYDGMLGLGDDGDVYTYDGFSGLFKRLRRWAKKKVAKVRRRIRSGLTKVLRKLPGGKYLIKIAKKIRKVAMKIVRPLAKFVGKYAAKLAPIAALIPGYGPAIAAGLHTAGKIANLMNKWDVKIVGKTGVRDIFSKNKSNIKGLQRDLAIAAKKLKAKKVARRRR
jgi:hypothetical protein